MSPGLVISKARQVQESLVARVKQNDELNLPPQTVCGLDVSYSANTAIGAAVLLEYPNMRLVEQAVVRCKIVVPYIPTFLSFREYPPISLAFSSLSRKADVCFVDAHGRSHPRLMGAASHFGVLRNVPTIGVAKRILCGAPRQIGYPWQAIIYQNEIVGAEVITKPGTKPIYISVGHRVSLATAIKLTQTCTTRYRLPEPTRLAHNLATQNR